ncbi:MAG TPA: type II restriction endonuclease [Gemmatimonadaceae bacterium]|nr:type II restriction endonuclease [Gemmatimonadaceae bacterium]
MSLDVRRWIETVSGEGWRWYVKRLSGNDTLLNKSHQAGPYIPKEIIFRLFPSFTPSQDNPRASFGASIDSHNVEAFPTAIWYNNKLRGGTRDECRITGWGGKTSPLLDPDATGAICVFAFHQEPGRDVDVCCVWLCEAVEEEDAIEDRLGPVEPGIALFYDASGKAAHPVEAQLRDSPCQLKSEEIPSDWRLSFPQASQIVSLAIERLPTALKQSPDDRLLRRRECEYAIFRSVEDIVAMPRIREGFATVDLFVDFANSVTNRRKSRAGASLELHTGRIFTEEKLTHSHDEVSEGSKRPDFLFPSASAYQDGNYPPDNLLMLAAKTTCKDRWRQILNEADRIPKKHLLTLQRGVSPNQFAEMKAAGVTLVVPKSLHEQYSDTIRPELLSLTDFIKLARSKAG